MTGNWSVNTNLTLFSTLSRAFQSFFSQFWVLKWQWPELKTPTFILTRTVKSNNCRLFVASERLLWCGSGLWGWCVGGSPQGDLGWLQSRNKYSHTLIFAGGFHFHAKYLSSAKSEISYFQFDRNCKKRQMSPLCCISMTGANKSVRSISSGWGSSHRLDDCIEEKSQSQISKKSYFFQRPITWAYGNIL